jgi:nucleoside-diphosphate-sugar epimerase
VTSGVAMISPGEFATEDMMRHQPGMPRMSEEAVFAFTTRGVRTMAMRLPQVHGGEGKAGFIGYLYELARDKGVAAYVGDGSNRWSAAHRLDVARLYRLALEKGVAGKAYHAVADGAVPMRDLAETFAKILKVETRSLTPEQSGEHFGWMAMFAGLDMAASSAKTQAELGWKPKEIGVIADIGRPGYFPA